MDTEVYLKYYAKYADIYLKKTHLSIDHNIDKYDIKQFKNFNKYKEFMISFNCDYLNNKKKIDENSAIKKYNKSYVDIRCEILNHLDNVEHKKKSEEYIDYYQKNFDILNNVLIKYSNTLLSELLHVLTLTKFDNVKPYDEFLKLYKYNSYYTPYKEHIIYSMLIDMKKLTTNEYEFIKNMTTINISDILLFIQYDFHNCISEYELLTYSDYKDDITKKLLPVIDKINYYTNILYIIIIIEFLFINYLLIN